MVLGTSPSVATVATVLAQQPDNGGQGADFGKSSPVGLLLLIVFFIAVAFLVRSMTKHLKRVPKSFDGDTAEGAEPAGESTTPAGSVAAEPAPDADEDRAEPGEPVAERESRKN